MATVLIADDDPNSRLLIRTILTHVGHIVLEAADGADALALARADTPDLILLDLSMPAMNGAEFLRALRADPGTNGIRVALYTATPMNAALRDFMEIYAIGHVVPKPSEPAALIEAIELALNG